MTIRSLEARDIEDVLAVQAACPEIAQWSVWDYERVAQGEMTGWVAEESDGGIGGFLVAWRVATDVEILNFGVRPVARRQGIGGALLGETLRWAKSFDAREVFLEVRMSNVTAQRFYERHGFRAGGRRPGYYNSPVEDALLLSARLTQGGNFE